MGEYGGYNSGFNSIQNFKLPESKKELSYPGFPSDPDEEWKKKLGMHNFRNAGAPVDYSSSIPESVYTGNATAGGSYNDVIKKFEQRPGFAGHTQGGGGDKTDWLGWAGIGTGLLQGAGGIMDYFSNMKGLELTEQAMNKKYAADDRNYLAQATSLNNVIDTRRDYINKTQGGRNTDFLKNIPLG